MQQRQHLPKYVVIWVEMIGQVRPEIKIKKNYTKIIIININQIGWFNCLGIGYIFSIHWLATKWVTFLVLVICYRRLLATYSNISEYIVHCTFILLGTWMFPFLARHKIESLLLFLVFGFLSHSYFCSYRCDRRIRFKANYII